MTFEEYVTKCSKMTPEQSGQRRGQFYSNTLHGIRPDLANAVPFEVDPFYFDRNIPAFLDFVGSNW
jgi:hypothetical protein